LWNYAEHKIRQHGADDKGGVLFILSKTEFEKRQQIDGKLRHANELMKVISSYM